MQTLDAETARPEPRHFLTSRKGIQGLVVAFPLLDSSLPPHNEMGRHSRNAVIEFAEKARGLLDAFGRGGHAFEAPRDSQCHPQY